MRSFKQYLSEENFEDFLRAHFGSEPAKPEEHILQSRITGGRHDNIPLYIGIDARLRYPHAGEGERTYFSGRHPTIKQSRRIHSVIPMKFDSEAVATDPVNGKIHIVRYDATEAYNQLRSLWQENERINAPAEKALRAGRPALLMSAADFMNHPILAGDRIIHDGQDISIGEALRKMHGGETGYKSYMRDPYAFKMRHGGEEPKDIVSFYRKIRTGGNDGGSDFSTPTPTTDLQLT